MPKSTSQSPLKKREVEILQLISQGMTKSEIAVALVLSVETVAWYGRQIFKKLEVKNWDDALARAVALGVIDAPPPLQPIEVDTSSTDAEEVPARQPVIQEEMLPAQEQEAAAASASSTEIPIVILPSVLGTLAPPLLLGEPVQLTEANATEDEASSPIHSTTGFEDIGPLPTFEDDAGVTVSTVIAPATYALSDELDLGGSIPPANPPPQNQPPQWDHELLSAMAGYSSHPPHEDIDDDWTLKSLSATSDELMFFDASADDTGIFSPTEAMPHWDLFTVHTPSAVEAVPDEPIGGNAVVGLVVDGEEIETSDQTPTVSDSIDGGEPVITEDNTDQPIDSEAVPETLGDDLEQDQPNEWPGEVEREGVVDETGLASIGEVAAQPDPEPLRIHTDEVPAERVEVFVGRRKYDSPQKLPLPIGAFIGREREIQELEQLLANHRVVHLTGFAGVGKTRLALETANQLRDEFTGGVYYLYLPSLTQANLQVAVALHLVGNAGAELRPQGKLLLILDHADKTSRPSSLVAELLSARPGLQIILTSRDWMGVSSAAELNVQPLEVPSIHPRKTPNWSSLLESSAMRLFVRATEQALPGYSLRESDATALGHLCGRSQGVPVLIDLLAAHLRVYPPPIILMQLDNRLRGLGGGRADPSPQQALNGILAWSQNLLKRDEQLALAGLSLFVGGWTEDGAAAVLNQFIRTSTSEVLSQLAHKRFIQILAGEDETKRYTMSDAVRDFATTKLRQHELYLEILRAFASAFWTMIENFGRDQERFLAIVEAEIDNIRSVLRLAAEHQATEMLTQMTLGMWPLWEASARYAEADYWFSLALAQSGQKNQDAQSQLRLISANVALHRGEHQQARKLLEECLVVYRLSGDHANERHVVSLLRQIEIDHPNDN